MPTDTHDMGLPPMSFIDEVFPRDQIPEFDRKYVRRQGPASVKKNAKGRTFTIGGEAATRIIQVIFADQGLTRKQIASIVHCSPSRVTEVIWGLDEAVRKGQIDKYPHVPRSANEAANDSQEAETDA